MPMVSREVSEFDIYHIVSRGVGRQLIFEDDADRDKMLELVRKRIVQPGGELLAWCLMGNHYHLLVHFELDRLARCMQGFNTAYARYFNVRYGRSGYLFQGRFASEAVQDDEQLLTVVRYIHQNPWKASIVGSCDYRWSSYREYLGGPLFVSTGLVLRMFGSSEAFVRVHSYADFSANCLDVERLEKAMTDDEAREIAESIVGEGQLLKLGSLPKRERDGYLRALRAAGLSIRRIERLTGIGRGIVGRCTQGPRL